MERGNFSLPLSDNLKFGDGNFEGLIVVSGIAAGN